MSARELTLIEHLGELRRRVSICVLALVVGTGVAFLVWPDIVELLKRPAAAVNDGAGVELVALKVTELLSTSVKVSLTGGFVLALPIILYQVIRFAAPGLSRNEKRYLFLFLPGALLAFTGGVAFTFFVMSPRAIPWLLQFGGGVAESNISISDYVDVLLRFHVMMGLAFETPMVMFLLAQIGIVRAGMFARFRKFWVVIAFALGAVITPTFDPVNQTIVALPLMGLYEIGIGMAWLAGRSRRKAAERAVESVAEPD